MTGVQIDNILYVSFITFAIIAKDVEHKQNNYTGTSFQLNIAFSDFLLKIKTWYLQIKWRPGSLKIVFLLINIFQFIDLLQPLNKQ